MNRVMLIDSANSKIKVGGIELIAEWQNNRDLTIWIDSHSHNKNEEKKLMSEVLNLHELAIQDAQRDRHPPKIEEFDHHTFVLLKDLSAPAEQISCITVQVAIFIGERFLMTRCSGPSPSTDATWDAQVKKTKFGAQILDIITLRLCRTIIDRYLKLLLGIETRLDVIEDQIIDTAHDTLLAELIELKNQLKKFRRIFTYQLQVFSDLKSKKYSANEHIIHQINDVFEHQDRAASLAALYYDMASDLIDGYISITSHRLNNIIKILTIVTTIFVPLSFLAGIYGMNFQNMPELHSKSGYFILLSIMSVIVVILLLAFRKKRWL